MNFRLVSAAVFVAALTACTPKAETDGAAAPAAPPAADIAAPALDAGPAAPNTTDTLSTTPPADAVAPPAQATAPAAALGPAAAPTEIVNGRGVYARTCAMCHGPAGQGTQMGVALTTRDPAPIAEKVVKGGEKMPPMAAMLSADDIDDVSKFVAAGLPQ